MGDREDKMSPSVNIMILNYVHTKTINVRGIIAMTKDMYVVVIEVKGIVLEVIMDTRESQTIIS